MRHIILIPTYNNSLTVCDIVRRALSVCKDVMVVNDGSTDDTLDRLLALKHDIDFELVSHRHNRGKGGALKAGFRRARELNYTHVLTLDADGQHFPEDAPLLLTAGQSDPEAIIVGCRTFGDENMPGSNVFANKFSNFWFTVQTLRCIPDTQSGFRLYPLDHIGGLRILTSRYEAELELLVFSAWRSTKILSVPVRVYYPPAGERVSHFHPTKDFLRITVLNTILCLLAIVYGAPRMLLDSLKTLFKSTSS
ncbi:MAG: glycosyltransferase family 2 protein [Bacteroidaceae bacterium]|nr:glycosyltransferase family 2 protein [Bacteroidaceae bacterium]